MTLPFRRRHHDHEASHDRARAIEVMGSVEPTEPAEAAWLESHLAGCGECRAQIEAYRADRELLRTLRDRMPEPPRDLWARTAATIELEAGRRNGAARAAVGGPRIRGIPIGVLSGVLVILVVVGTSLMPRNGTIPIGPTQPPDSGVAVVSQMPEATPLAVTATRLNWVQEDSDGNFELVFAHVAEVCVTNPDACAPLEDASTTHLTLTDEPEAVVISPENDQLIVVSAPTSAGGGEVLVFPVPTPEPSLDPGASPTPPATPEPTPGATPGPGESPGPSVSPDPNGSHAILTGVIVVGEAAYSEDGGWLAFSARPKDGSSGPDLYVWRVGDPAASAVTADHRTFFAGWLGNLVLASRVLPVETPNADDPDASSGPGPTPDPSAAASAAPSEEHAVSFVLDPETAAVTDLAGADIWRPVVDPTSRRVVYWAGTLVPDGTGTGWILGTGQLVLDGWNAPPAAPAASSNPGATAGATPPPAASIDPFASPMPTPQPGPAGSPVVVAAGPIVDFDAMFDLTGTRLAIWIADPANADVGTLQLVALDAETGEVDEDIDPLPGVAAIRGFSIGESRLAWVTPPGQDGESSHVQVLAWTGDEFGQGRGTAGERLVVVR